MHDCAIWFTIAHLFLETHRVLTDEIVGHRLIHDLEHHVSALGQAGNGAPFPTKVFEHGLQIDRPDIFEILAGKTFSTGGRCPSAPCLDFTFRLREFELILCRVRTLRESSVILPARKSNLSAGMLHL